MSIITDILNKIKEQDAYELQFYQAVKEVMLTLEKTIQKHSEFVKTKIYERLTEPDRVIIFKIPWIDDNSVLQINRGFRVQFNNALGPYKGGIRFHPSVNLDIIKSLAFEQVFKNSLTTLPMGGAKGGSNFNPKGKSNNEIMNFCYSFMRELYRYIGPHIDVPAGDIGVSTREIGYLYGYYKKIRNEHTGVLTGKGLEYGGSQIRQEATGYGLLYFVAEMLATRKISIENKIFAISGCGNVAQYAIEKVNQLGGKVIMISDSNSCILDEEGIDFKKSRFLMKIKNLKHGCLKEYAQQYIQTTTCFDGKNVWDVIKEHKIKIDIALPCAIQNELNASHAQSLIENGCICIAEGANMPCTPEAITIYKNSNILYGPGKAANAGGVAVSGLEMTQNNLHLSWDSEEINTKLISIMHNIHKSCLEAAEEYGMKNDYVAGANISAFLKIAKTMLAYGIL